MFDASSTMKITVQPGDTFVKVNGSGSVWKIERVLEYPDLLPHIRLIEHGGNGRTATIALPTLMDQRMWRRAKTTK